MTQDSRLILLLLILFSACTTSETEDPDIPEHVLALENLTIIPENVESRAEIALVEDVRFEGTDEIFLGTIRHVEVDSLGRLFLGDAGWGYRGIHVYNSDGNYIKKMGGGGRGPGEFLSLENMRIISDELYLYDDVQQRVNIYSLDELEYNDSQILDSQNWSNTQELQDSRPSSVYPLHNGNYLIGFFDPVSSESIAEGGYYRYFRMNRDGDIISDEILNQNIDESITASTAQGKVSFSLEYPVESLFSISDSDELITAWTEEFLIKWYDSNGEIQHAIFYPFQRAVIDVEKVLSRFDKAWVNNPEGLRMYKTMIRDADLPERWPALNSMLTDEENRIWISTIGEDENNLNWWVIEQSGGLIGRFDFPRNRSILKIKNEYLYALSQTDGIDVITRYRIEMNEI